MTDRDARPPTPPEPTPEDFEKLKVNVQGLCRTRDVSQNRLEADLNLSTGFLSKMWKGRTRFDLDILLGICRRLSCEPLEVVEGTTFVYLLDTAPPGAESEAVRALREELDKTRLRAAAAEAEVAPLRDAVRVVEEARAVEAQRAEVAETRCTALESELRASNATRDAHKAELAAAKQAAAAARTEAGGARLRVVAAQMEASRLQSTLDECRRLLGEWQRWGTQRDQRATFLGEQLQALQGEYTRVVSNVQLAQQRANQLQVQASSAPGSAIGGGLFGLAAGFLIGAAAASESK